MVGNKPLPAIISTSSNLRGTSGEALLCTQQRAICTLGYKLSEGTYRSTLSLSTSSLSARRKERLYRVGRPETQKQPETNTIISQRAQAKVGHTWRSLVQSTSDELGRGATLLRNFVHHGPEIAMFLF